MSDIRVLGNVVGVSELNRGVEIVVVDVPSQRGRLHDGEHCDVAKCQVRARVSRKMREEGRALVAGERVCLLINPDDPRGSHVGTVIHSMDHPSPKPRP